MEFKVGDKVEVVSLMHIDRVTTNIEKGWTGFINKKEGNILYVNFDKDVILSSKNYNLTSEGYAMFKNQLIIVEEKEKIKEFTKKDLLTGMKVKLRNGCEFIVMLDCMFYGQKENVLLPISSKNGWIALNNYDYDLSNKNGGYDYDIVEVYKSMATSNLFTTGEVEWKKIYPKKRKMTIKEIQELVGEEIEIVEE